MSTAQNRLTLLIDVFEKTGQRAFVLPGLTPPELVEAILREFARDLEYLGETPEEYQLVRALAGPPLADDQPLGAQTRDGETLALVERRRPQPPGTQAPTRPIYLRDTAGGQLFKLHWLPAIIGRPDEQLASQTMLAVDLSGSAYGLRVSRRHAQIVEEGGQLLIESLARNNPTAVVREGEAPVTIDGQRLALRGGDLIRLQHSGLTLKLIVRERA